MQICFNRPGQVGLSQDGKQQGKTNMNRGWKTIFFKNKPQYKSIESWELFRGKKYLKIDNNKIVVK